MLLQKKVCRESVVEGPVTALPLCFSGRHNHMRINTNGHMDCAPLCVCVCKAADSADVEKKSSRFHEHAHLLPDV